MDIKSCAVQHSQIRRNWRSIERENVESVLCSDLKFVVKDATLWLAGALSFSNKDLEEQQNGRGLTIM